MTEHRFHLTATWPGGRNSVGSFACDQLQSQVSIATSMGGPGIGTNPDEMLLGAAAMCYLITLAAMLERAAIGVDALALESEIIVTTERGAYVCKRITHRPRVTLAQAADADTLRKAGYLATMAEKRCMISNALRGNVEIVVEPRIDEKP